MQPLPTDPHERLRLVAEYDQRGREIPSCPWHAAYEMGHDCLQMERLHRRALAALADRPGPIARLRARCAAWLGAMRSDDDVADMAALAANPGEDLPPLVASHMRAARSREQEGRQ